MKLFAPGPEGGESVDELRLRAGDGDERRQWVDAMCDSVDRYELLYSSPREAGSRSLTHCDLQCSGPGGGRHRCSKS